MADLAAGPGGDDRSQQAVGELHQVRGRRVATMIDVPEMLVNSPEVVQARKRLRDARLVLDSEGGTPAEDRYRRLADVVLDEADRLQAVEDEILERACEYDRQAHAPTIQRFAQLTTALAVLTGVLVVAFAPISRWVAVAFLAAAGWGLYAWLSEPRQPYATQDERLLARRAFPVAVVIAGLGTWLPGPGWVSWLVTVIGALAFVCTAAVHVGTIATTPPGRRGRRVNQMGRGEGRHQ